MRPLLALSAVVALVVAGVTTAAAPAEALTTERFAGPDRYATSVAISRGTTNPGTTVFLASGERFPDALSAGPVVAAERGHLLLTLPGQLPSVVAQRIAELRPTDIVVVGSTASVSAAVATEAGAVNSARVTRIGGADRVATSLLLLERLAGRGPVDSVWVASGQDFPDALVAASVAGRDRSAVILDHHGADAASARAWVERVRPHVTGREVRIAGGEPSVSAADAQLLRGAGATSVTRYAGQDRHATARVINDAFSASPAEPTMLLTTGSNFPDALSGAVHAASRGIPMYLTSGSCDAGISQMLREEAAQRGITRIVGLGSAASISDGALSLGPCASTLQQQIGAAFGTFAPRTLSGTGSQTIDLGTPIAYAQLRASMPSSAVNQVSALDAGQQMVAMPLSITGAYSGTTLLATDSASRPARFLEVQSSGAWTIELRDLTSAPVLTGTASGSGDAVYLYGGAARTLAATHSGTSYFGVRELTGSGAKLTPISSCCTAASPTMQLHAGPSVLNVLGEAPWTVALR